MTKAKPKPQTFLRVKGVLAPTIFGEQLEVSDVEGQLVAYACDHEDCFERSVALPDEDARWFAEISCGWLITEDNAYCPEHRAAHEPKLSWWRRLWRRVKSPPAEEGTPSRKLSIYPIGEYGPLLLEPLTQAPQVFQALASGLIDQSMTIDEFMHWIEDIPPSQAEYELSVLTDHSWDVDKRALLEPVFAALRARAASR